MLKLDNGLNDRLYDHHDYLTIALPSQVGI